MSKLLVDNIRSSYPSILGALGLVLVLVIPFSYYSADPKYATDQLFGATVYTISIVLVVSLLLLVNIETEKPTFAIMSVALVVAFSAAQSSLASRFANMPILSTLGWSIGTGVVLALGIILFIRSYNGSTWATWGVVIFGFVKMSISQSHSFVYERLSQQPDSTIWVMIILGTAGWVSGFEVGFYPLATQKFVFTRVLKILSAAALGALIALPMREFISIVQISDFIPRTISMFKTLVPIGLIKALGITITSTIPFFLSSVCGAALGLGIRKLLGEYETQWRYARVMAFPVFAFLMGTAFIISIFAAIYGSIYHTSPESVVNATSNQSVQFLNWLELSLSVFFRTTSSYTLKGAALRVGGYEQAISILWFLIGFAVVSARLRKKFEKVEQIKA